MKETIDTIIKWHSETFKEASLDGQIAKWTEEYRECLYTEEKSEEELEETADMAIVSCGIARFDYTKGIQYLVRSMGRFAAYDRVDLVWQAVEKKMEKNRKRIWNKTADGQYHHENGIED